MWIEKHGKTWRIRDVEGGRKITLLSGLPTKKFADDALTKLSADKLQGDFIDPRAGRTTVGQWLDAWWPSYAPSLKPSSLDSANGILRRYILPAFAMTPLDEVDPLVVQRWTAQLLDGTAPGLTKALAVKTVMNAHGLLHKVFSAAVQQRLLRYNPTVRTGMPEKPHYEARFLTEPEAARLLAHTPEYWRPLVLLLLSTGLRWSEAAGLRVGRVDVLARRLTVVETMQERVGTGELVFVSPKSRMSKRAVTFPVATADALIPLVAGRDREALVFQSPGGGPVRYRIFRKRVWIPARTTAGLPELRIHDIRHTHAAWLISAGVPLTGIQRRLGHSSIMVTSDMYGHLMPAVDEGIMIALDKALPEIGFGGNMGGTGGNSQEIEGTQRDSRAVQSG